MKKSGKLFLGGGFLGTENRSAGEGVQTNPHLLQSLLGKWGPALHAIANGRDAPPVIPAEEAAAGYCAVTLAGCPLGGGKVSGGMAKNLYPKGLRLKG